MSSEPAPGVPSPAAPDPATAPAAGAAVTDGAAGDDTPGGLSARDRAVLAFERQWWRFAGAKDTAIRESFGMSATRYYQVLNALIDRPEAVVADPLLVRRLRRMRAARQRQRSDRVLGSDRGRD
ncbi:DUF3263 domain-containing protein [Modestobacter muralis]|uniref:DUF3263 domain-containing protein n=1 Tax=Modestobacter muralis TaxID=1608614 RepID=A0A6P0EW80_9ACTN|nr:DUF3263 domain-containing protein [Modestobacter muralis]NEK94729.1 DUF3263 domain-containing protein [Modestobacter muralis]NEN51617.1 DUF3263 domain-containing protein [Modestobacter muralis]